VVYLKKDADKTKVLSETKNSFGANITDLLADSFFIGDGLIGDFAKGKIEETIEWLNDILKIRNAIRKLEIENDENVNDSKILKLKKKVNKNLEEEINLKHKNFKKHLKLIQIIDEKFIKEKLLDMYNEALGQHSKEEILKNKIEEMQKELTKLQNPNNNA
jgi:hypothetical protein